MSKHDKIIITIFQNFLRAGKVDLSKQELTDVQEFEWDQETLATTFEHIHKTYKTSNVRIIIGERLAYVLCIPVDITKISDRNHIRVELANHIPEVIDKLVWDYKHIKHFSLEEEGRELGVVQIIAMDREIANPLAKALKSSKLKPEAVEPISITLARQLKDHSDPLMLLHIDHSITRAVSYQGLVVVSQVANTAKLGERLKPLMDFVFDHFSVKPEKLIISGENEKIDLELFATSGLTIEKQQLTPMIYEAAKQDLKGPDEDVLNIEIKEDEKGSNPIQKQTGSVKQVEPERENQRSNKTKFIFIGIIAIIIAASIGVGIFFMQKANVLPGQPTPTAIPAPTVAPTPESTPLPNPEDIKIQVLNGSGTVGKAGEISDFLAELEFTNVETDNADNYDYQNITIQTKPAFSFIYQQLSKEFEDNLEYQVNEQKTLSQKEIYDVIIIIGSKEE